METLALPLLHHPRDLPFQHVRLLQHLYHYASTIVPAPTDVALGTTKSCLKWYVVQSGNICYYIDNANGISFTQFRAWNTGIDAGCSNIIPGVAYFVSSAAVTKAKTGEIEVEPVWKEMLPPKFPGVDRAFDEIVTEEE
jgi:hypothetical protein